MYTDVTCDCLIVNVIGTAMKLINLIEYKCNRCDDPTKPLGKSKTDPLKERKKIGTTGRGCKGRMVLKVYELYNDIESRTYTECVGIISDSLIRIHASSHDMSIKYV